MEMFVPLPIVEEPILRNRWSLHLPAHLKIENWCVDSVSPIRYNFGRSRWDDIRIGVREMSSFKEASFSRMLHSFSIELTPIRLELLDPVGDVLRTFTIEDYEVVSIGLSDLDYAKDGLLLSTLTISPKAIAMEYDGQVVRRKNRFEKKKAWFW